jgi:hypothetical protein
MLKGMHAPRVQARDRIIRDLLQLAAPLQAVPLLCAGQAYEVHCSQAKSSAELLCGDSSCQQTRLAQPRCCGGVHRAAISDTMQLLEAVKRSIDKPPYCKHTSKRGIRHYRPHTFACVCSSLVVNTLKRFFSNSGSHPATNSLARAIMADTFTKGTRGREQQHESSSTRCDAMQHRCCPQCRCCYICIRSQIDVKQP